MDERLESSHEDVKALDVLLKEAQDLHHKMLERLSTVSDNLKNRRYSLQDWADVGFLCREIQELSDEQRKDAKARHEAAATSMGDLMFESSDPAIEAKCYGRLCRVRHHMEQEALLPKRGTPEYLTLLTEYFGVPMKTAEMGILEPHWVRTGEHLTIMAQEGKKIPKAFGRIMPKNRVIYTRSSKKS